MKNILKIALPFFLLLGVTACDSVTELDLLDDPNQVSPDRAGVDFLYNSIQLKFAEIMMGNNTTNGNVNSTTPDLYRFASDLTRHTAMTSAANYREAFQATYFDALWLDVYADLFPDVAALNVIAAERGLDGQAATANIMKAYTMMMLVDIFGDVPYSQIGQGVADLSPAADSGADVYAAALALLDDAIAKLDNPDLPSINGDNFYNGNTNRWIALANTLKLRSAVTTRLVNTGAAATINTLVGGSIISGAAGDWQWNYGDSRTNPSTRHPNYVNSYESFDGDYLGNYFMWTVTTEKFVVDSIVDPRARYYFYRQQANLENEIENDPNAFDCIITQIPDLDARPASFTAIDPNMPYCLGSPADQGYFGRDHGNNSGIPPDGLYRTVFGAYPAGGLYDNGNSGDVQNGGEDGLLGRGIIPLMPSFIVDFYRAEAALTLGTSDDAAAMLESGMRGSFAKMSDFGPDVDSDVVDAYVAYVMGRYNAADAAGKLAILGKEFYIALWGHPWEQYNLYRRTCTPVNMQPLLVGGTSEYVQSAPYPAVYVQRNIEASQKPDQTVKVFWNTNGGGCNY